NVLATRADGLDLSLDGTAHTRVGSVSGSMRLAYTRNFEQRTSKTSGVTDVLNTVGNPLGLKYRMSADWSEHGRDRQGWSASAAWEHDSAYEDVTFGRRVQAFNSFDASLGFRTAPGDTLLSDVDLQLVGSNLFNASPPFVNREPGYDVANGVPFGRVLAV